MLKGRFRRLGPGLHPCCEPVPLLAGSSNQDYRDAADFGLTNTIRAIQVERRHPPGPVCQGHFDSGPTPLATAMPELSLFFGWREFWWQRERHVPTWRADYFPPVRE